MDFSLPAVMQRRPITMIRMPDGSKNFTAGFLTTCGLDAVGSPCEDEGESLPLHGRISNTPAEHLLWDEDDTSIWIKAVMNHARIFERKLMLTRVITCSKQTNEITICDTVENIGDAESPLMLLYHMNMGYPLLSEAAELFIPAAHVTPRNEHAAKDLDTWDRVLTPTPGLCGAVLLPRLSDKGGPGRYFQPADRQGLAPQLRYDRAGLLYAVEDDGCPRLCDGSRSRKLLSGRPGCHAEAGQTEVHRTGTGHAVSGSAAHCGKRRTVGTAQSMIHEWSRETGSVF